MANEVYYSGLGDLRLSAVLHQEMNLLLADRAGLWSHPGLINFGDIAGRGSTQLEVPLAGLNGYDEMAAVAENASTSNTALTDASPSITIARQGLQYQISDLANMTDSVGLNAERLAASMVKSAEMRFTSMVTDVTDGFSNSVGASGTNMSVDNWMSAQSQLTQSNAAGPYFAILHPVQFTDLQASIRAEAAGPLQWLPASAEMVAIKGPGFAGQYNGVDIFISSKVPTANAGADRAGAMFAAGAVGYAEGSIAAVRGAGGLVMPAGTKVLVEFERDSAGAMTKVVGNYYCGVAIIQDSLGVSIITDA